MHYVYTPVGVQQTGKIDELCVYVCVRVCVCVFALPSNIQLVGNYVVTSSRKKGQAGLADVAVCHLVVPAGNIQLHSDNQYHHRSVSALCPRQKWCHCGIY